VEAQAKALASDYLKGHMAVDGINAIPAVSVATVSGSDNGKTYTVDVSYTYALNLSPLMSVFNKTKVSIPASSRSTSARAASNSLSMFLVPDRSGSI